MIARRVPEIGPLTVGAVYRRADLHERFGGNRFAGIVPSKKEPIVLLFHTREPVQQFYGDGIDDSGVYWYSGEGRDGEMKWSYPNRCIRDHQSLGNELHLFERVQRQGGHWKFSFVMHFIGYRKETSDRSIRGTQETQSSWV